MSIRVPLALGLGHHEDLLDPVAHAVGQWVEAHQGKFYDDASVQPCADGSFVRAKLLVDDPDEAARMHGDLKRRLIRAGVPWDTEGKRWWQFWK